MPTRWRRWVLAEPEFDHQASAAMRRVFAKSAPLSKVERKRLHKLQALYDALALEALAGAGSPVPDSVHILLRIRHERRPKGARLVRADDSRPLLCFNGSHSTPRCRVNARPRVNAHRSWPASRF